MNQQNPAPIARLSTMPAWARGPLEKFVTNPDYEPLLPALPVDSQLGYGFVPSVSVVTINPDPAAGEVFVVGKKGDADLYAYAKPGLLKLASAAGIQMRTERMDDRRNPDYCEVRALGAMRNETGQPMIRTATKAFYMPDVSAEAWRSRVKRNKPGQYHKSEAQLKELHEAEMLSFRKHLLRRTEAGAITAVVRELLGVKGAQLRSEIARPKVIIRVDFRPDHTDPVVKRFLLEQSASATASLYGPPRASSAAEIVAEVEPDEETIAARAAIAAAPAPAAPAPEPEPSEDELIAQVEKGADILGLNFIQRSQLFEQHGGDLKAMLRDLNARVEGEQAKQ